MYEDTIGGSNSYDAPGYYLYASGTVHNADAYDLTVTIPLDVVTALREEFLGGNF